VPWQSMVVVIRRATLLSPGSKLAAPRVTRAAMVRISRAQPDSDRGHGGSRAWSTSIPARKFLVKRGLSVDGVAGNLVGAGDGPRIPSGSTSGAP